jgi:hypothetical protein
MFYKYNLTSNPDQKSVSALVTLTPAESKRLIARGVAALPEVKNALEKGIIIIARGTTDAFVAEEIMGIKIAGKADEYCRGFVVDGELRVNTKRHTERSIGYDFALRQGQVQQIEFQTILKDFSVDDVFIKGPNAGDGSGEAAVLVAGTESGTVGFALPTLVARGSHLIVPVGLEKLVPSVSQAAARCGIYRYKYSTGLPCGLAPLVNAKVVTEIQALAVLSEVTATHVASGGIAGSEGTVVLVLEGSESNLDRAFSLVKAIKGEPPLSRPEETSIPAASLNYDPVALRRSMSR